MRAQGGPGRMGTIQPFGLMEQAHHERDRFGRSFLASMLRMEVDLIIKALRDKRAVIHGGRPAPTFTRAYV